MQSFLLLALAGLSVAVPVFENPFVSASRHSKMDPRTSASSSRRPFNPNVEEEMKEMFELERALSAFQPMQEHPVVHEQPHIDRFPTYNPAVDHQMRDAFDSIRRVQRAAVAAQRYRNPFSDVEVRDSRAEWTREKATELPLPKTESQEKSV